MARYVNTVVQLLDTNGLPIVGAKKFFFEPNSTTFKTIYVDSGLTVAASNPQISDANGRYSSDIFLKGIYKEVQQDNSGTSSGFDGETIWTKDPIGDVVSGQWTEWINTETYNIPDIVLGSNNSYYVTNIDSNQGNDPVSSPTEWQIIDLGQGGSVNTGVINDLNGNPSMVITATANAVNHLELKNSVSNSKPQLNQIGASDVGLDIEGVEFKNGAVTAIGFTGSFFGNLGGNATSADNALTVSNPNLTGDIVTSGKIATLADRTVGSDNIKTGASVIVNDQAIQPNTSINISNIGLLYLSINSNDGNDSAFFEILVNSIWVVANEATSAQRVGSSVMSRGSNVRVRAGNSGGRYSIEILEA